LAGEARPVALELGEDQLTRPHAREAGVCVGRVFVGGDAALFEELPHVAPPNAEPWAHVMAAAGGHAAQAGEPTPPQKMKDDSLDQVIGGVRDGDDVRACLDAGAIEKRVAERPGCRLERTPRQGLGATLRYQ